LSPPPVFALLGAPVGHSLSPLLHATMLRLCGLPGVYVALEVAQAQGDALIAALRTLGLAGVNLTIPLKECALGAADRVAPCAAAAGACNTLVREQDGCFVAYNTDGDGLLDAIAEAGPLPRRAAVLGAGGAGRGVAAALLRAGVEVHLRNRDPARAARVAAALGCAHGPLDPDAPPVDVDLIVDCTAASGPVAAPAVGGARLRPGGMWVDTNYFRPPLGFAALQAAGFRTQTGHAMLLHQARRAFSLFTGVDAPTPAALREGLCGTAWPAAADERPRHQPIGGGALR